MLVSMNMSRYRRMAGKTEMKGIQMGTVCLIPMGEMNQSRKSGLVTWRPSGTFSFWVKTLGKAMSTPTMITMAMGTPKSPRARRI